MEFVKIIPILSFISLAYSCGLITDLGDLNPVELKLPVNSDIVFNCTLNNDSEYTSKDINFKLYLDPISKSHVHIIDNKTAQLKIANATEDDSGRYYCLANKSIVCLSEATIGYKPQDVPVKDLSCVYKLKEKMKCSYTKPSNKIETDYVLVEIREGLPFHCKLIEDFNKAKCIWANDALKTNSIHHNNKFQYAITASNVLGKHKMHFNFNLSSIVMLDAPKNFTFDQDSNTLAWDYPKYIADDTDLLHLLMFKVLINNQENETDSNIILLNYSQKNVTLSLKPFTTYNFSISCKVNVSSNENWSILESIIIKTKGDVPASPPVTISQAFETAKISPRTATIYWNTLPKIFRNSLDISYHITCVDFRKNPIRSITTNATQYTFENLASYSYEFRIYSMNLFGLSKEYTKFILSAIENIPHSPRQISVHQGHNSYQIKWEKSRDSLQNYTVFWCKEVNDICATDINWRFVSSNYYSLNILHENYKFGVSANTPQFSSGISWSKCVINEFEGKINRFADIFAKARDSKAIEINWNYYCEAQKKVVKSLEIQYCLKDNCSVAITQNEAGLTKYLIRNLEPNSRYKLHISSPNIFLPETLFCDTEPAPPPSPYNLNIVFQNSTSFNIQWQFTHSEIDNFKIQFLDFNFNFPTTHCKLQHCSFKTNFNEPLRAFTNYTISLLACYKNICSNPSKVSFQTSPSKPGKMSSPSVEPLGDSKYRIRFTHPREANGPIDYYYVNRSDTGKLKKYSGNAEFADIEVKCSNHSIFKISVSAVNMVNGAELRGDSSDFASFEACAPDRIYATIALCILILLIFTIILSLLIFYASRYMYQLKAKKKHLQIRVECNIKERENLVKIYDDDDLMQNDNLTETKKPSLSITNTSITSNSSIGQSHASDINCPSISNSEFTTNSDPLNYRENREYFISSNLKESTKPLLLNGRSKQPLMQSSTLVDSYEFEMVKPADINEPRNYVTSSSGASGQYVPRPVVNSYVQLSPKVNLSTHYVPHTFATKTPPNSTNV